MIFLIIIIVLNIILALFNILISDTIEDRLVWFCDILGWTVALSLAMQLGIK